MRLVFCGVRGSTPAPGPEFVRVGGHTSCVAIARSDELPRLVLDAGTGLRVLTPLLDGAPFVGTILLTHLHWDHVEGLPFFAAADRPDAEVRVLMPAQGDAFELLSRAMSPPHFPIGPEGLQGAWSFDGLEVGSHRIEGFDVEAREIPHKGGRTFGYRVTEPESGACVAYLPDHRPLGHPDGVTHEDARDLARGADLLIHDAQFTAAERQLADAYGHAIVEDALELAASAGVGRLALFHHAPARTDDQLAAIRASAESRSSVPIVLATQGLELTL